MNNCPACGGRDVTESHLRRCQIVTIWPEIRPHGVRLACSLPAGHDGDHACADIEYLTEEDA